MPKLTAKLTVFTGSMFASKSSALIGQGERHVIAGHNVIYCKPEQDTRYSETEIVTHSGGKVEAITLRDTYWKLFPLEWAKLFGADVVLIDEVQFFNNLLIPIVKELLDKGKVVYVAGLDMDFTGNPFEVTAGLMSIADEITKLKAVCTICGEDSYLTAKTGGTEERMELGGKEKYFPACRECYKLYKEGK